MSNCKKQRHEEITRLDHLTNSDKVCGDVYLVGWNDAIDIVSRACCACYDKTPPESYEDKANYISRRINAGHTSILEHSNIVFKIYISEDAYDMFLDLVPGMKYLNVAKHPSDQYNKSYGGLVKLFYIGGSVRAYRYLIENSNSYNDLLQAMIYLLSTNLPYDMKELFDQLISFEEYKEDKNLAIDYSSNKPYSWSSKNNITAKKKLAKMSEKATDILHKFYNHKQDQKSIEIINIDNFSDIDKEFYAYKYDDGGWLEEMYAEHLSSLVTMTVCFNYMSANCTHQLVRHRNGITQQSMRYVSMNDAYFNCSTALYNKQLKIKGTDKDISGKEVFDTFTSEALETYKELVAQGVKKEDARALLPMATEYKKIYITFNMSNLNKFFELRTDEHAQEEIRFYATALKDVIEQELCYFE